MTGAPAGRTVRVDAEAPASAILATAASLLRTGGLVAFPTETFYGLGANAFDADAVGRVFRAKGRPADKPLLVLVDSLEMASAVVAGLPARAQLLIARYWPGPLTLILPARPELPSALTAGTGTVGVRIPGHPVARALVAATRQPLTAPSANPDGAPPPRTADEVLAGLGDAVDLVLDGGPTRGGPASTVLDLCGGRPRVVRPGAVTLAPEDLAG
ncbi:MAG TPA: L-threonylcarbamoyladenylate synthase [Methylomirabilota bacterium]|jgi:L-threonylcarbamoyladenylate synthase|nr:L-threonylcarbamoyladenylate synthase [Methylomirabilota bacterium]